MMPDPEVLRPIIRQAASFLTFLVGDDDDRVLATREINVSVQSVQAKQDRLSAELEAIQSKLKSMKAKLNNELAKAAALADKLYWRAMKNENAKGGAVITREDVIEAACALARDPDVARLIRERYAAKEGAPAPEPAGANPEPAQLAEPRDFAGQGEARPAENPGAHEPLTKGAPVSEAINDASDTLRRQGSSNIPPADEALEPRALAEAPSSAENSDHSSPRLNSADEADDLDNA